MAGLCQCGCGRNAPTAPRTDVARGWVRGQPLRFIHGHNGRVDRAVERSCPHCDEWRMPDEFYANRPECKPCTLAAMKRARSLREPRKRPATDKTRAQARLSYVRHREQRMKDVRAWQLANAERRREISRLAAARRKARQLQQFVEDIDMQALILRDEGYCGICGEALSGPAFHIDHIIPLARGGEHSMRNVQLAHATCNVRKGAALSLSI